MLRKFRLTVVSQVVTLMIVSLVTIVPPMMGRIVFSTLSIHKTLYFSLSIFVIVIGHVIAVRYLPSGRKATAMISGFVCIAVVSAVWFRGSNFLIFGFQDLFGYRGLFSAIVFSIGWPIANALVVIISSAARAPK